MSNKSKALSSKALKRAKKQIKSLERNRELFIGLAEVDDNLRVKYLFENFNEKQEESLGIRLEKFKNSLAGTNVDADFLEKLILSSIFFDKELLKDIIEKCS